MKVSGILPCSMVHRIAALYNLAGCVMHRKRPA